MAFKNFLLGMFFLDLELFTATSNELVRDDCHSRQRGPSNPRKRLEGHIMLEYHYFAKAPLHPPHFFFLSKKKKISDESSTFFFVLNMR